MAANDLQTSGISGTYPLRNVNADKGDYYDIYKFNLEPNGTQSNISNPYAVLTTIPTMLLHMCCKLEKHVRESLKKDPSNSAESPKKIDVPKDQDLIIFETEHAAEVGTVKTANGFLLREDGEKQALDNNKKLGKTLIIRIKVRKSNENGHDTLLEIDVKRDEISNIKIRHLDMPVNEHLLFMFTQVVAMNVFSYIVDHYTTYLTQQGGRHSGGSSPRTKSGSSSGDNRAGSSRQGSRNVVQRTAQRGGGNTNELKDKLNAMTHAVIALSMLSDPKKQQAASETPLESDVNDANVKLLGGAMYNLIEEIQKKSNETFGNYLNKYTECITNLKKYANDLREKGETSFITDKNTVKQLLGEQCLHLISVDKLTHLYNTHSKALIRSFFPGVPVFVRIRNDKANCLTNRAESYIECKVNTNAKHYFQIFRDGRIQIHKDGRTVDHGPFKRLAWEEGNDAFAKQTKRLNTVAFPTSTEFDSLINTVLNTLQNKNVVLFGFGYSGSGKTHTLLGNKDTKNEGVLMLIIEKLIQDGKKVKLTQVFEEYFGNILLDVNDKKKISWTLGTQNHSVRGKVRMRGQIIQYFDEANLYNMIDDDRVLYDGADANTVQDTIRKSYTELHEHSKENNIDAYKNELINLMRLIDDHRRKVGRIRQTPNNEASSRSHLHLVFTVGEGQDVKKFVLIDAGGIEDPIHMHEQLYNKVVNIVKNKVQNKLKKWNHEKGDDILGYTDATSPGDDQNRSWNNWLNYLRIHRYNKFMPKRSLLIPMPNSWIPGGEFKATEQDLLNLNTNIKDKLTELETYEQDKKRADQKSKSQQPDEDIIVQSMKRLFSELATLLQQSIIQDNQAVLLNRIVLGSVSEFISPRASSARLGKRPVTRPTSSKPSGSGTSRSMSGGDRVETAHNHNPFIHQNENIANSNGLAKGKLIQQQYVHMFEKSPLYGHEEPFNNLVSTLAIYLEGLYIQYSIVQLFNFALQTEGMQGTAQNEIDNALKTAIRLDQFEDIVLSHDQVKTYEILNNILGNPKQGNTKVVLFGAVRSHLIDDDLDGGQDREHGMEEMHNTLNVADLISDTSGVSYGSLFKGLEASEHAQTIDNPNNSPYNNNT